MFQINEPCFITLNKVKGISSASLLNKLKFELKIKKAGFCGTLDPLAGGVLVVAVGKATKLISLITDSDKTYSGKMILGFESSSYDTDTELVPTGVPVDCSKINIPEIEKRFTGIIKQTPPIYSAVKIDGVRAYKLARKGESPKIKEREVCIKKIDLVVNSGNEISFKVQCSKGTYIRSLVSDIGKLIGCGAVMTELTREKVGSFDIERSVTIDEIKLDSSSVEKGVITLDSFLSPFKKLDIDEKNYAYLRNGSDIDKSGLELAEGLNYVKFNGMPSFILEKKGEECSYFAYLGN